MDYTLPLVTPEDLVDPKGDLLREDFPGDAQDLEDRLLGYVLEADAKIVEAAGRQTPVTLTEAQARTAEALWAYHRAYAVLCRVQMTRPTSTSIVDSGTVTYSPRQADAVCALAADYEARFLALVPVFVECAAPQADTAPPASAQVPLRFTF